MFFREKKMLTLAFLLVLAIALFVQGCSSRQSQPSKPAASDYPNRPVTMIVGWAVGGASDLLARASAQFFPKYANNQPLVVQNIPGSGGVPAVMEFTKAKPDGYTILHWNTAHVIKTHMSKVEYEATSFAPIIMMTKDYNYLLVKADSPYKNLNDFIEAAKKKNLSIANAGVGGGNHLAALLFEDFVKVPFKHVPFDGGGPAVSALLSGVVDASMNIAPEGLNNVKSGQLRILAVFSEQRIDLLPDVPTAKEQGLDLILPQWRGVVAHKDTPADIQKRLHDIFAQIMKDQEFLAKMKELGFGAFYMGPEEFGKFIQEDSAKYERVIKEHKLGDRYPK